MIEFSVRSFFERYERCFNQALVGHVDMDEAAALYASEFVAVDFDAHYFVQQLDGQPKVFGWVSGDEQALLKKHGIT